MLRRTNIIKMDTLPFPTFFKENHIVSFSSLHRSAMKAHFLSLDENDRLLRFGLILKNESIVSYVDNIDFNHDVLFGVFDARLNLVGVGHLAFPLKMDGKAEFGISVIKSYRGKGVASQLFERAIIHCRNLSIHTLAIQYLTRNAPVMHIARKLGMKVVSGRGDSDACLTISPGNSVTFITEVASEQVATLDYTLKANFSFFTRFLEENIIKNRMKNSPYFKVFKSSEYS